MRYIDEIKLNNDIKLELNKDLNNADIAGAAVIVAQNGKVVCDIKCGYKNIDTKEPLIKGTLFRYASLTKPITGVAALIGVQNGCFNLNDNISDYFPDFDELYLGKTIDGKVLKGEKIQNDLKIYHLLSHSSGLLCSEIGNMQIEQLPKSALQSCKANVEYCAKNAFLSFEPGEGAAYSAYTAFDIIARLLEIKSGMTYAEFLNKYIFEPLNIKDITFCPTEEQWQRMIAMHNKEDGKMVSVNMGMHTFEDFPLSYTCAGASLCGSIEDYHTFAQMLLQNGEYNGVRILEPEIAELQHKAYVKPNAPGLDKGSNWGLGVRVVTEHPYLTKGTYGWSGAYGTHMFIDTENKITAIYMKNNRWHDSHGCGQTGINFEKIVMASLK